MKNINLLILQLIIVTCNYNLNAQCWNSKRNTTTTDWRKQGTSNKWDWTQEEFDVYIKNQSGATTVRSPFWVYKGATTNDNPALFDFRKHQSSSQKDFHPEDGWELVTKNFGINSNNPSDRVDYPFYALYNKYTGKLRCFMLIVNGENNNNQGALLHISFDIYQRKTALFQHMQPLAQDVVNFDPFIASENPNYYTNTNYFWLFSETVLAYDPCTCVDYDTSIQTSTIVFNYVFVDESKIDAKINGVFKEKVTENKQAMSGNPTFSSNDLLTFDGIKKAVNAGQKGYKEYSKYQSDINKFLKEYTDSANLVRIWNKLETLKGKNKILYDDVVEVLFPQNNSGTPIEKSKFINGAYALKAGEFLTIGEAEELIDLASKAKQVVGVLPYLGAAIGVIDFLVSSTKQKTSQVSVAPTIFEVNLTLQGNIKSKSSTAVNQIYTPGNYKGSNNFKPIYNNILGVFNILELPDFEYGEIKPKVTNLTSDHLGLDLSNECKKNTSNLNNEDGAVNVIFRQYKPKTPIKFVVNPASDLEVVSAEAALVVRYRGKDRLFLDQPKDFENTLALPFYKSITAPEIRDTLFEWGYPNYGLTTLPEPGGYINNHKELRTLSGSIVSKLSALKIANTSATAERIKDIENNTNLSLDFVSPNFPFADSSIIQFRTDFLPVNCSEELSITLLGNNNFSEVFLKLYILLKHKNDPNLKPVTMILSYDLKNKLTEATKSSNEGSYDCKVWGTDWEEHGSNCCLKCGKSLDFKSGEVSNYIYSNYTGFKLTSIPFNSIFFQPHNQNYTGQQYFNTIGNLHIPDNTIVPANSIIKAVGSISLGTNISIGDNSIIESETNIEINNNNNFGANVEFRIADLNSVKYGCHTPDYQKSHLSDDEINVFCNSIKYKQRAFSSILIPDTSVKMSDSEQKSDLKISLRPNPTAGKFNLTIFNNYDQNYSIELMDITGKIISQYHFDGKQVNQTIETNDLASGLYFVRVTCGTNQKTEKLIVSK